MNRWGMLAVFAIVAGNGTACTEDNPANGKLQDASTEAGLTSCSSDKQCSTNKQVCDLLFKKCVDCLFDFHCGTSEHCVNKKCVGYTSCKNSLDCKNVKEKPICSSKLHECVACESNSDCNTNEECVNYACVAYTPCKNSKDCTNQVCDIGKGKCVDCLTKSDCGKNQDCIGNKCKTYYPCKSDKDCVQNNMLCNKTLGRCAQCLKHADCPIIYYCQAGACVLDICAQNQRKCVFNGVANCSTVGDGYDQPTLCGSKVCVQTGTKASCQPKIDPDGGVPDLVIDLDQNTKLDNKVIDKAIVDSNPKCGCTINKTCFLNGAKETGGCGVCTPSTSKISWTKPSGCLVTQHWSKRFGGSSEDNGTDVAVDKNGNIYIIGCFEKSISFGGNLFASKGSTDIFLASFTPAGAHRWSKVFGSSGSDRGHGVAVDNTGNIYITGYFQGSVNFGSGILTSKGTHDIFLASFTASGAHRWSKTFGSVSKNESSDIAVDSAGNVTITGYFNTEIDFGGGKLNTNKNKGFYISSFTSKGTHRWSKHFGDSDEDRTRSIAVDGTGNVYITGLIEYSITFGSVTLTSKGQRDIFVASFAPSGAYRWSKHFGGSSSDRGYGVATDGAGNVYITGYYFGSASFGGSAFTSKGSYDIFVASFTTAGIHRWSKTFGDSASDHGFDIVIDNSGNVYITGVFFGSSLGNYKGITFGGPTFTSSGNWDIFVASFTSGGKYRWSRSHGGIGLERSFGIAVDASRGISVVGQFSNKVDFGGGPFTSSGGNDVFLLKVK